MTDNDYEWKKATENMEKGANNPYDFIDILILYLSVANNPDIPKNLREFFNELIDTYLERNHTTLEDIYNKHFSDI